MSNFIWYDIFRYLPIEVRRISKSVKKILNFRIILTPSLNENFLIATLKKLIISYYLFGDYLDTGADYWVWRMINMIHMKSLAGDSK